MHNIWSSLQMHFSDAFKKVEVYTKELKEFLSGSAINAYAAPLPLLGQHEKRVFELGGYNPEANLMGGAAVDCAILNLFSYFAPSGTNTFHVRLCPGLIHVKKADMLEVERLVALINSYKKLFAKSVDSITDKRLKHDEIHTTFPMMMTKQVSREINFIPSSQSLTSIGFSLAGKMDQRVISYEEAVQLCTDIESSSRLSNYRNCELRYRRSKTKRFYANCRIKQEGVKASKPIQLQGGMPIIASSENDEPIKVNHLSMTGRNMAKRSNAANYELICPTHHIYAMMPK